MEESTKVDGFDKPRVVDNRGTNAVKNVNLIPDLKRRQ